MQFRMELFFRVVMDVIFYSVFLGFYQVLYSHTALIGGWNRDQAFVFISGFLIVDALQMTFFADMYHYFQSLCRDGSLDYYLTKPISSWFFAGFRYINFGSLLNVGIAIALWSWAIFQMKSEVSWQSILVYAVLLMASAFLYFLVIFALLMSLFWTESAEGPLSLYFECVNFASRPHHIFKGPIKALLLTMMPFSVFASIPAQAFFDDIGWLSVMHVFGVVAFFLGLNFWLWDRGLRRYGSAMG